MAADALRRPERLDELVAVCECDALSRPGSPPVYRPGELVREAFAVVTGVDAGAIATDVVARAAKRDAPAGSEAIAKAIRAARLAALRRWRDATQGAGSSVEPRARRDTQPPASRRPRRASRRATG